MAGITVAALKPDPRLIFNPLVPSVHFHFHFPLSWIFSSNYCWNAHEKKNQFDGPGTKGLTSLQKLSRIILDLAMGLQKTKRTVSKYVTIT